MPLLDQNLSLSLRKILDTAAPLYLQKSVFKPRKKVDRGDPMSTKHLINSLHLLLCLLTYG